VFLEQPSNLATTDIEKSRSLIEGIRLLFAVAGSLRQDLSPTQVKMPSPFLSTRIQALERKLLGAAGKEI
jgi:hypothetical protein